MCCRHVKSDKAQSCPIFTTSPISRHLRIDISSCALFTIYPNCIMWRHPTPLKVISHQSAEGQFENRNQAKMATYSVINMCTRDIHFFPSFAHFRAASTIMPQLPKATFIPSIQSNPSLPSHHYFFHINSSIHMVRSNSLHVSKPSQYSLIHLLARSLSILALLCTSSLPTLSVCENPTKLLKHL